jgi:hypothetical protein
MSSRPDPIDERFEELAAQLRATRPRASGDLRLRVRELARVEPEPRRGLGERLLGWRPRRLALVVAAALLVVGAIAFFGSRSGTRVESEEAAEAPAAVTRAEVQEGTAESSRAAPGGSDSAEAVTGAPFSTESQAVPPPSGRRLQNYSAELTVRVRDLDALSEATAQAMATARRLGGFVVSARYEAPSGPEGDSLLVVRVPVTKVQAAIAAYSDLGTLAGQSIRLQDVQPRFNELAEQIETLQKQVADLARQLAQPGLSDDERLVLRSRLEATQAELRVVRDQRQETLRQARLARISLTLTTRGPNERPEPPGDAEQTLRDALGVVATVFVWALAGAIVAVPFLALVAVIALAGRRMRRRSAERLLERPGS